MVKYYCDKCNQELNREAANKEYTLQFTCRCCDNALLTYKFNLCEKCKDYVLDKIREII